MANKAPRKVAIVHDWLYGGGAERVVLELHRMYPEAPIYTSYCSPEWRAKLDNKVVTGYLQRWPFSSLRKVQSGAIAMREETYRNFKNRFSRDIIQSYGSTECLAISINNDVSSDWTWDSCGRSKSVKSGPLEAKRVNELNG